MPDEIDDLLNNLAPKPPPPPRRARPTTSHLDVLTKFAQDNKLTVGSTTGGRHNRGSLHYSGNAIDIKGSGAFDDATVQRLAREAQARGLKLRDERRRPAGQKVWGGPHVHVEYAGVGDDYDALLDSMASPASAPPIQPQFPTGTTRGRATGRAELVRPRARQQGQVEASGLGAPPVAFADMKQRDEVGVQQSEANRQAVRQQVRRERMSDASTPARLFAKGMRMFGPGASPISAVREITTGDAGLENEEAERRLASQRLAETPEVVAGRREFGTQSAPVRALTMPAGRAGAGLVKTLAGLSSFGGIAPNEASDYLNQRAAVLEQAASLAPLDAGGQEIQRGLPEKAGGAVVDVGFTVAQLVAMKKATGLSLSKIMMLETALKTSDRPAKERAERVAQAGVMGRALDVQMSRAGGAAANVVPTLTQEVPAVAAGQRDPYDAAINTAVQAGTGALLTSPRRAPALQPMPEVTTREAAPTLRPSELQKRVALRGEGRETERIDPRSETRTGEPVVRGDVAPPANRSEIAEAVRAPRGQPVRGRIIETGRGEAVEVGEPLPRAGQVPEVQNLRGVSREAQETIEPQPPVQARVAVEESAAPTRTQVPASDAVVAAEAPRSPDLVAKPRWQHRDFGLITEADNQVGVGRGRVRVTAEDGSEHVIQKPKGTGAGNQIAIPVRDAQQVNPVQGDAPSKPWPVNPITVRREPQQRVQGGSWESQIVLDVNDLTPAFEKRLVAEAGGSMGSRYSGDTLELFSTHDTRTAAEGTIGRWQRALAETKPAPPPAQPESVMGKPPTAEGGQKPPSPQDAQTARKKVADEWRRNAEAIRREDEYASHVKESTKAKNLADALRYADEIEQGLHDGNFTIAQRLHYELTGETVPFLPPTSRQGGPTEPAAPRPSAVTPPKGGAARVAASSPSVAEARVPPLKPPATKPPPVEVGERKPSQTAPKDAAMQADREALGLPELDQVPRVSSAEVLAQAKAANAKDPRATDGLIEQALSGGKNFNNVETMQVNLRAQEAKNRINVLSDEIYKATDPQVIAEKRAEQDVLINEVGRISEAQDLAGAEWSRAGTARQRAINQDFDLVSMVVRMKKARGRELTADERARIDQQSERITQLETELVAAQNKAQTAQLQKQIDRVKRQTKRGETKQVLDDEFAALKQQFATAKAEVPRVQASGLAALAPEGKLTVLIAKMARNRVKAGVVEAEKLVDEVYGAISDRVEGLRREDVRDAILNYGFATGRERTRQTQLLKVEADVTRRLEQKDFSRVERQPVVYTRETYALQKRVDELKAQFARELHRAERGVRGRIKDTAIGAVNIPKTLLSMADLSAVLRQGGVGVYQHPVLSGRAGVDMLRSFSERGFANVVNTIKSHKDFELAKRSGVEFTGVEKADPILSHREEGFLGSDVIDTLAKGRYNIPGKGLKAVKDFSERTFVSFLDSQRMRIFAHQAEQLRGMKLSPKELQSALKAQARYINIITGRGYLGRKGEQAAPLLNAAMFSPRLVASRFQLLNRIANPTWYATIPKGARKLQMIDNIKFAGGVVATLALAKAAGADVNLDPDDSDFLKIKIGDARYDTLTGLQQPLRFLYRMAQASLSDSDTYAGASRADITKDFARSKSSPTAGLTWDWIAGKNRLTGKKFELAKDVRRAVTPLPYQDFQEAIEQDGAVKGIVETLPALFGVGVQTYPMSPEKPTTHAEKLARRIIRDKMPDTARTEEEIETSRKATELRARSRRGEDVTAEIPALNLTDRQIKTITEAKGVPRFQEDVKRLGVEDVLRVWRVASPAERDIIKPLLAAKADAVDQLDKSKQPAVKAQLRAIGIVPIEELPVERQQAIRSQRRLESREQTRERREKQRSQPRQRPSAGYGY